MQIDDVPAAIRRCFDRLLRIDRKLFYRLDWSVYHYSFGFLLTIFVPRYAKDFGLIDMCSVTKRELNAFQIVVVVPRSVALQF